MTHFLRETLCQGRCQRLGSVVVRGGGLKLEEGRQYHSLPAFLSIHPQASIYLGFIKPSSFALPWLLLAVPCFCIEKSSLLGICMPCCSGTFTKVAYCQCLPLSLLASQHTPLISCWQFLSSDLSAPGPSRCLHGLTWSDTQRGQLWMAEKQPWARFSGKQTLEQSIV